MCPISASIQCPRQALSLLPREPLAGLDVAAVQQERRRYWDRLMDKVLHPSPCLTVHRGKCTSTL